MNEPMSDERLAEIRRRVKRLPYHPDPINGLLAEVDRLRFALRSSEDSLALARYDEWAATDARAALARVRALHQRREPFEANQQPGCSECLDNYGAGADWPCATIEAVAADERPTVEQALDMIQAEDEQVDDYDDCYFDFDASDVPDGFSRCRNCGHDTPIDDQAAIDKHVERCNG